MPTVFEPETQQDLVDLRSMDDEYVRNKEVTEDLKFPGVETLHKMPRAQAAQVFANILKSRPSITRIEYVVGRPYVTISHLVP